MKKQIRLAAALFLIVPSLGWPIDADVMLGDSVVGPVEGPVPVLASNSITAGGETTGRSRDAGFPAPPAQIRTCATSAYGSYLE